MSDKMREEFEVWAINHKNHHNLPLFVFYKDHNGDYVDIQAKLAWQAWQASRQALVVEFPPQHEVAYRAYDSVEIRYALKDAGIKWAE